MSFLVILTLNYSSFVTRGCWLFVSNKEIILTPFVPVQTFYLLVHTFFVPVQTFL